MSTSNQVLEAISERIKALSAEVSSLISMMTGATFDPKDMGFKGRLNTVEDAVEALRMLLDEDKVKSLQKMNTGKLWDIMKLDIKKLEALTELDIKQLKVACEFHELVDEVAVMNMVEMAKERKTKLSKLQMGLIQAVLIFVVTGVATYIWGHIQQDFLAKPAESINMTAPVVPGTMGDLNENGNGVNNE